MGTGAEVVVQSQRLRQADTNHLCGVAYALAPQRFANLSLEGSESGSPAEKALAAPWQ